MTFLNQVRASAIELINDSFPSAQQLSKHELDEKDGYVAGWSFPSPVEEVSKFWLLIDAEFPYSVPRVVIKGTSEAMLWPHVESDGRLCLSGDNASIATHEIKLILDHVLHEACCLLKENSEGLNTEDFVDDFNAYWLRSFDEATTTTRTLLETTESSIFVRAWHGKSFYFVAENNEKINNWLKNYLGKIENPTINEAALIWLKELPTPAKYPSTAREIRIYIKNFSIGGLPIFDKLITAEPNRSVIILMGKTAKGEIKSFGIELRKPSRIVQGNRKKDLPYNKGFRKGKVPATIITNHYKIRKTTVKDVNSCSSRLPANISSVLSKKSVAIVGCGSLGSFVAMQLAQSGVRNLHLIDFDKMNWENICRHVLGAESIGKFKAESLQTLIKQRIPQMESVDSTNSSILTAYANNAELFNDIDLIISLTGDWNSESALNDLQQAGEITCPIMYGWMETRAAATQVVLMNKDNGCLRCGFDDTGAPLNSATLWSSDEVNSVCGGGASIYGSVELSNASSLVSSLAIDYLTNALELPVWRTWLGPKHHIYSNGGLWNPTWIKRYGDPFSGGRLVANKWPSRVDCLCNRRV
ncbi:ThiF family adenylyltransferase [Alteromonas sp. R78001]|uniref:ThiF family adenylyltransferase n=1 Tax=Alteromonas sp. R78001 TaxID=3093865 RepID=UPI0036722546